jgi:hypothetical protein
MRTITASVQLENKITGRVTHCLYVVTFKQIFKGVLHVRRNIRDICYLISISLLHSVQTSPEAHSDFYRIHTAVNQSVDEAQASHPFSAEVKNAWNHASTPPYVFMT